MKLIALETSTNDLSAALWCDGVVLTRSLTVANGGSGYLLPWVQELLAEAGLSMGVVDAIAYGAGPGAFTGLRLACGLAQGLAFGLERPVLGVSSLEAQAWTAYRKTQNPQIDSGSAYPASSKRIFSCLDARMNEVYGAVYEFKTADPATALCLLEPFVCPPEQLASQLQSLPDLGCGDGLARYPELQALADTYVADIKPQAAAVAELAAVRFMRGEAQEPALALPLYVRNKVALTTAERLARGGLK